MYKVKQTISFLLVVCILSSIAITAPIYANAKEKTEGQSTTGISDDNVNFSSHSSMGNMISSALQDEQTNQDEEDVTNKITDVTVEGTTAVVEFNNDRECNIVVAIFDEDGKQMLASGIQKITQENAESATVAINTEEMPQYFIVKAFMLDEDNKPLSSSFENTHYTKEFQDFLSKTTEDFSGEEVYNLDDSNKNNFAVFDDNTLKLEENGKNNLQNFDETSHTYTFTNVDENLTSLKEGDIFYFTENDDYVIIKVKSIALDGTTANIVEDEDVELTDVFQYVKIDTENNTDDTEVDMSVADEGVTYEGTEEEDEDSSTQTEKQDVNPSGRQKDAEPSGKFDDIEQKKKSTKKFSINKEFKNSDSGKKVKLSASLNYTQTVTFKVFVNKTKVEVHFSNENKTKYSIDISGSIENKKIPIAKIPIPTGIGDLTIEVELNFVVKTTGQISFSATATSTTGFIVKTNGKKVTNTSKPTTVETSIEVEASVFAGIEIDVTAKAFAQILNLGVSGKAGFEIKGSRNLSTHSDTQKHLCTTCVKGSVNGKIELSFVLKIDLKLVDFKLEYKVIDKSIPLFNFYFSSELGWGKGECPNNEYLIKFTVVDSNGKALPGAKVGEQTADKNGKADLFLKEGKNTVEISCEGYQTKKQKINVTDTAYKLIKLNSTTESTNETKNQNNPVIVNNGKTVDSGQCGENVYYKLYENGTLVISGTGAMYNYNNYYWYETPWYSLRAQIKKVIIGNGVTSIGDWAFYCTSLTSITIPDSVTKIGWYAFEYCKSLTSITIPDSVTSIGRYAFAYCKNLTSVTIGNSVTEIGYRAFEVCTSLTSITIPDGVTSIGGFAFSYCTNLTSVTIPDSVTSIGSDAFYNCTSLTSVTIGNGVTEIGYRAFEVCTSLKNINVNENNNNYSSVNGDLYNKNKTELVQYAIGKENTNFIVPDSVTEIGGYAFKYCESLTSITIPDSVTEIGDCAFEDCTSLTSVTIPDSVTSIGYSAFARCTSLTSVTIPDSVTSIGFYAFGGCTSLTDVYYAGTQEQWNEINIDSSNSCLTDATIHYNAKVLNSSGSASKSKNVVSSGSEDNAQSEGYTVSKSELVPNAEYVLLIIQGSEEDYTLSRDTLLYVAQAKSDENGTVSFTYYGDFADKEWVALICGECNHSLSDWQTVNEPTEEEEGLQIRTCTICGEIIESRTIEKLPPTTTVTEPTTEVKPTEPTATEPTVTEPTATEPTVTEPTVTEPTVTEPTATEPTATEPTATEPTVTEPSTTTQPATTKPVTTQPTTTKPVVKKTTVKLAKSSAKIYVKKTTTIKATVTNGKGKTTYKSNKPTVAKVSSKGVVTGLKKGTAKITVTNNGVKKVFTVTVQNPKLNKTSVSLEKKKTFTIKITGKVGKATFKSNKTSVATVNKNGKITAKKKGNATITVKTNGVTLKLKVKVK